MKKIALTAILITLALSLAAADILFSGKTSFSSCLKEAKFSNILISQTLELNVNGDKASLYLNGGVEYDALKESVNLSLSEAYANLFAGKAAFRLGKQMVSWGNAELLPSVDVITPADLSDPVNMKKKAISALKASYDAFPYAVDFYWIPVFTPSYSLPVKPEPSIENSEYALKASAYTSAGDFALYGYYGWEDIPSVHGFEAKYERLGMAGVSAAVPVGEITFKTEAGWFPKRDKVVSASAGLEWIHNDLTVVAELYGEWDRKSEKLSGRIGTVLSYKLFDGDLELSVAGLLEAGDYDGAVRAQAIYSFTDELKASVSAVHIFEGPDGPGTYGVYKNLNCIKLGALYSF